MAIDRCAGEVALGADALNDSRTVLPSYGTETYRERRFLRPMGVRLVSIG